MIEFVEEYWRSTDLSGDKLLKRLLEHPLLQEIYRMSIGGRDNLSLFEHTQSVMRSYEIHFSGLPVAAIEPNQFRLLIALHDLGKPKAMDDGAPETQHSLTLELISSVWSDLSAPDDWRAKIVTVINGDPIGMLE